MGDRAVVPLLWLINVGVIAREERYLERKFGDAYRAYKGAGTAVGMIGGGLGLIVAAVRDPRHCELCERRRTCAI